MKHESIGRLSMGHLHYRLNFDLNKSRQKFHHKISNIRKMLATGGGSTLCFRKQKFPKSFATQHFPENSIIQRTKSSLFTNFAIPACQGPLPASWAPFFYFFGVLHPHTPQVAQPCSHFTTFRNVTLEYY